MPRLPIPASDDGTWGDILNQFLEVEHNSDGTQKTLDVSKGGTGATDTTTARSNLGLGTASTKDVPASGNALSTQVVKGDDTRLTNSRTPSGAAGGDLSGTYPNPTVVGLSGKADDSAVLHKASNLSDVASVSTARTSLGLGTSATKDVAVSGDASSTQVVKGDDTRLTNSRTPSDGSVSTIKLQDNAVTAAKLSVAVNNDLSSAQTAVQSVNSKTGTTITLAAADVSAVATSEKGASGGVATLTGTTLTAAQLPSNVITKSSNSGDTGKAIDAYTGAPLVVTASTSILPLGRNGLLSVAAGTMRVPITRAATIVRVRAMVGTAPTGAAIKVDLNKNGTTVFTTQQNRPTIADGGTDSGAAVPDVTALAAGDYLTLDVDQIGSTVQGADLTLSVEIA